MKNRRARFLSKEYIILIIVVIIIFLIILFILSPSTMEKIGEFFKNTKNTTGMGEVRETVHSWWK